MRQLWLSLALTLAACGGGDSSGPSEPTFPAVAGTYILSGQFDGVSTSDASFTGTLRLNQPSRESGTLSGTLNIQLRIGSAVDAAEGPLDLATLAPDGGITFKTEGSTGSWTFTGNIDGNGVASGRHTINSEEIGLVSGNWVGHR